MANWGRVEGGDKGCIRGGVGGETRFSCVGGSVGQETILGCVGVGMGGAESRIGSIGNGSVSRSLGPAVPGGGLKTLAGPLAVEWPAREQPPR